MPTALPPTPAAAMPSAMSPVSTAVPHATVTLSPEQQQVLTNYAMGAPKTPLAMHAPWLTHTFAAFFLISAVLLIVLLAVQTTKQESLGGSMSSRGEAFRPRLGIDGQLARATEITAIAFVIFATLVALAGI